MTYQQLLKFNQKLQRLMNKGKGKEREMRIRIGKKRKF